VKENSIHTTNPAAETGREKMARKNEKFGRNSHLVVADVVHVVDLLMLVGLHPDEGGG